MLQGAPSLLPPILISLISLWALSSKSIRKLKGDKEIIVNTIELLIPMTNIWIKISCCHVVQHSIANISMRRMYQKIVHNISSVIPNFHISFRSGFFLVFLVTWRIRDMKNFECPSLSKGKKVLSSFKMSIAILDFSVLFWREARK